MTDRTLYDGGMAKMLGRCFRKNERFDCPCCYNPDARKVIDKRRERAREKRQWRLDTDRER